MTQEFQLLKMRLAMPAKTYPFAAWLRITKSDGDDEGNAGAVHA